jgi:hypothetical protein
MENFSVLLGRLGSSESAGSAELDGPTCRVSTKVAEVVLSLGGALARSAAHASSSYYDETLDSPQIPAALTLAELKELIVKAPSIAELHGLRRRFARSSHPDRHKASEGSTATWEMAAANRMIDEAICAMRRPR